VAWGQIETNIAIAVKRPDDRREESAAGLEGERSEPSRVEKGQNNYRANAIHKVNEERAGLYLFLNTKQ